MKLYLTIISIMLFTGLAHGRRSRAMSGEEEASEGRYDPSIATDDEGEPLAATGKVQYDEPFLPTGKESPLGSWLPIKQANEDNLYALRKKYDVLLLLLLQTWNCKDCAEAHRNFINVSRTIAQYQQMQTKDGQDLPSVQKTAKKIGFAILDAEEEHEEFTYLMSGESEGFDEDGAAPPGQDWAVPSVLIFKWDYQKEQKKPPMPYLLDNSRPSSDLAGVAMRLAGPSLREMATSQELEAALRLQANGGLCVVIWDSKLTDTRALQRLLDLERQDVTFLSVAKISGTARQQLAQQYNPQGYSLVAYLYELTTSDDNANEVVQDNVGSLLTKGFTAESKKFEKLLPQLKAWVLEVKRLRPGHEYDGVTKLIVETVPGTDGCLNPSDPQAVALSEKEIQAQQKSAEDLKASGQGVQLDFPQTKQTDPGTYAHFDVQGANLKTGVTFLRFKKETLRVGGYRGDLPRAVTMSTADINAKISKRKNKKKNKKKKKVESLEEPVGGDGGPLAGMCPGMVRRIIVPPGDGYEEGNEPPKVEKGGQLIFTVTMRGWSTEHKVMANLDAGVEDALPSREELAEEALEEMGLDPRVARSKPPPPPPNHESEGDL